MFINSFMYLAWSTIFFIYTLWKKWTIKISKYSIQTLIMLWHYPLDKSLKLVLIVKSIIQSTGSEEGNLPYKECGGLTQETEDFHSGSFSSIFCYFLEDESYIAKFKKSKFLLFILAIKSLGKFTCIKHNKLIMNKQL